MIPPTTDVTIIFPYDQFACAYDSSFYSAIMTENRYNEQEIHSFLKGIADKIANSEATKDSKNVGKAFSILGLIFFLCVASMAITGITIGRDMINYFPYIFGGAGVSVIIFFVYVITLSGQLTKN